MTKYGMLVCSFYIKKKYSHESKTLYNINQEIISNTEEQNFYFEDFFKLISSFCKNYYSPYDNEKTKKLFSIEENSEYMNETDTYRALSFIIRSGSYGVEADMTNRHTNEVSYHRSENEADIKPFYCVIFIPKDTEETSINKGIFVFQSIATFGVKTITVDTMKRYFSQFGITLETRSVSVDVFLQKLIDKGALKKVTLYKNKISPNTVDNILLETGREERSYINPIIRQDWLNKILKAFKKADEEKVVEIPDGVNFDDISITFTIGRKQRTVRLRCLDKLSIVEDIPDDIAKQHDETKIVNYMIETANEYKSKIVFEITKEG